jgi:hypothetical protein
MDAAAYSAFTDALSRRLDGDPRVVGLVALGSMSGDGRRPTAFSDHDFFVVTRSGRRRRSGRSSAGFPARTGGPRPPRDGARAEGVLDDGTCSSSPSSTSRSSSSPGRTATASSSIAAASRTDGRRRGEAGRAPTDRWLCGSSSGTSSSGDGARRAASSSRRASSSRGHATGHLLRLLSRHVAPEAPVPLDDLDPFRRFERAFHGSEPR